MKKTLYSILFAFLLIGCRPQTYRMEISYVSMDIITACSVNCDDFENAFCNTRKTIHVSDQDAIINIWNLMNELVFLESIHNNIDTRMKLKIWKGDEIHIVCLNNDVIFFNGKIYIYNDEIRHAIEDVIENNTEKE